MNKPLEIAFHGSGSSDFIENRIRERVARLERQYPQIVGCRVVVEIPQHAPESGKMPLEVAVEVKIPGKNTLVGRASAERQDMKGGHETVVNAACEAVERRLAREVETLGGHVKHHENAVETGQVIRLFPDRNYGFIEVSGGPELYFTRNAVTSGRFDDLAVGMLVEITRSTEEGPLGPQASSVALVKRTGS